MIQTSAAFRRDTQSLDGSISLSEIISALSYALDLTEGAVHGHALRSCLLGMRIAEEAKLPSDQTSSLYFALLLKDIGCSRNGPAAADEPGRCERADCVRITAFVAEAARHRGPCFGLNAAHSAQLRCRTRLGCSRGGG